MTTTTSTPRVDHTGGPSTAHDWATRVVGVALRLAVAYLWYENLSWKNPPDFGQSDGSGLYGYTNGAVTHPVLGVWTSIIENVVLPHFALFGWFTFLTEAALAIFLALGLATRFWALVGVMQSFAIYFTVGNLPNEWKWSYFLMAATHLAILGMAAGRTVGLDQILRPRVAGPSVLARLYRLAS